MDRIIDYGNLVEKIKLWILDYVKKNNIECLVVGVSGGIDSAVVSTLCAETNIKTIVVNIPINSNKKNSELSEKQIQFLKIKYGKNVFSYNIDLSKTFEEFKSNSEIKNEFNSNLGFANTKSRLRMLTLYQIASSKNGIVVGTGNKVEDFGIGFFTKYGDGGVDISPIADLYKSEVRNIGRYLQIPKEIINAEPTDGLWEDNRTDETQIGVSYDELEWAMEYGFLKKEKTDKESEIFKTFLEYNQKNKHKMVSIPIFNLIENKIL